MTMEQAVTDVIIARSRSVERLPTMVVWSIAAHIVVVTALLVFQSTRPDPPPRTIMTISLGGAVGPKTGGLTQIGGRPVQAPPPPEPVRRAETAPAPKPPPMALPDPRSRPPQAKPQQAPREATGRTPTTGPEPTEGSAKADTQNRGQGFGLSSAGGAGGGVRTDVANFCCPEYILDMTERVRRNWNQRQGVVGITTMRFTIQRDGTITDVQRDKSSGFEVLDAQSDRALRLTRLPPLPGQFTNPTLTVYMEFEYLR
jgi:periplasmic protein TonB